MYRLPIIVPGSLLVGLPLWPRAHGFVRVVVIGSVRPVTGLKQIVAMVAVGIWTVPFRGLPPWLGLIACLWRRAAGAAPGLSGPSMEGVEIAVAVRGIVLGLVVATALGPGPSARAPDRPPRARGAGGAHRGGAVGRGIGAQAVGA